MPPHTEGKSKIWSNIMLLLLALLVNRTFLLSATLLVIFFVSVLTAKGLAGGDQAFLLKSGDECVLFSINGSETFRAKDAGVYRKPFWFLPDRDLAFILASRNAVGGPDASIWDSGIFEKIRSALKGNPWIAKVGDPKTGPEDVTISRRFPRFLIVSIRLRVPAAAVLWNNKRYCIDSDAILLPFPEMTAAPRPLIVIVGIKNPPNNVGEYWGSPYMEDALSLLRFLSLGLSSAKRYSRLLPMIESVSCEPAHNSIKTGKPSMTVGLSNGTKIIWDMYFEVESQYGRPGRDAKLRGLRELLDKVEDLNTVAEINLSFDKAPVTFREAPNGER
ncbi:MAG: hypothetical protein WC712_04050 [Candidatus Brocadiia bacterium]